MSGKPRVLCVDDKIDNLRIRATMLERFGCEVALATDRDTALQAFADGSVDLAIVDYHLAYGESGEDLARDLRASYPKLPMIMLTGDITVPASAAEHVDAIIIKGMSGPTALLDKIKQLLPDALILGRPPVRAENETQSQPQTETKRRVR